MLFWKARDVEYVTGALFAFRASTWRRIGNASPLSVHPTGMAADLRRSSRPACRAWLEKNLLTLEGKGVLEATKENHPPHYHVTLYPQPYMRYLASRGVSGVQVAKGKSGSSRGTVATASASGRSRSGGDGGSGPRRMRWQRRVVQHRPHNDDAVCDR